MDEYPTDGSPPSESEPLEPGWRDRLLALRVRMRSTALGRFTFGALIAVIGGLVVAIGVILIPFPGPGWLIVLAGIAIWSLEFAWARRLLGIVRRMIISWTRWVRSLPLSVRAVLGLVATAVIVALAWLSVTGAFGFDIAGRVWR